MLRDSPLSIESINGFDDRDTSSSPASLHSYFTLPLILLLLKKLPLEASIKLLLTRNNTGMRIPPLLSTHLNS
jgi:hypothetical protein